MRTSFYLMLSAAVLFTMMACSKSTKTEETEDEAEIVNSAGHETADDYTWDSTNVVHITLNGTSITVDSGDATVDGSTVTIISAGNYSIKGTLSNGQIIVNLADTGRVRLILNGVNIANSTTAPVFIHKSAKTIIILASQTQNYVSDATSYVYASTDDNEPNAAIFSKSNLSIGGSGSLSVVGNYNDGISSKDGLIIKSGTINVTAADDGIRGKDYLIIKDGSISITSGGDGLKSDNDNNTTIGYISIETGIINITSGGDAIGAQSYVKVTDGTFTLTAGGGSSKAKSSTTSTKGIKGPSSVIINGGTFAISSADDAVHSNATIEIKGGALTLSSSDDGLHADASVVLNNCDVNITKSVEGIESALITVDSSKISIVASDDGFNATSGTGSGNSDNSYLYINSGYIYVNASGGDALDSNGSIVITGGTIVAHGPASQPEVGMDYNGTCKVTGGTVVISGTSSNMTQAPSTSSTQYSVLIMFTASKAANSIVHIQDSKGNDVMTFAPVRAYQSIIVSSSSLVSGGTYTIYTGGTSSGTVTNGYYTGGTYSGGTSYQSFTISSMITTVGSISTNPGGRQ